VRQLSSGAWCPQWFRRIGFTQSFSIAVSEEGSETGKSPCDGRSGVSALVKPGNVVSQESDFDFAWRYRSPTLLFDELAEMSEIVGVGLDRQFGCVPFDLQIIEEGHLR
jgi:hypothetical protein